MPIHNDHTHRVSEIRRAGSVGTLIGCACMLALGCAGDREMQRGERTARDRSHETRQERRRDVEHDRDVARAERLDDHDRVPDATRTTDERIVTDSTVRTDTAVKPVAVAVADAGGTDADRQLTARIRKSIVADDRLSVNAKNVQIISSADDVTLRGPVATAEEKSRVASYAERAAGSRRVNNQLEIAK